MNKSFESEVKEIGLTSTNGILKFYLMLEHLENILKRRNDQVKLFPNLWKTSQPIIKIKDIYVFVFQRVGICENIEDGYVISKNILPQTKHNKNSFKYSTKNNMNNMFDIETELCKDQTNDIFLSESEFLIIKNYFDLNKIIYNVIEKIKTTIKTLENIDGVKKLLHVDENCYDLGYPCKHTVIVEDINKNQIKILLCKSVQIRQLIEKQSIQNKKMIEHFYESYDDFDECCSDTSFCEFDNDPFNSDLDMSCKYNSFHLVQVSKENKTVEKVLLWSDRPIEFKQKTLEILLNLIPVNERDENTQKLKTIIEMTMSQLNKYQHDEHIDIIDELNYLVDKSYEIRFRNKRIDSDTIIV